MPTTDQDQVKAPRRLPLLVAASVIALCSTTLANAGGTGPAAPGAYAFSASLSTAPVKASEVAVVKQSCAQSGTKEFACDVKLGLAGTARPIGGTLLDRVRGISGSLAASCDLKGSAQADVRVSGTKIEIAKIAGNFGTQTCSWNASLSNGGRISGTLTGSGIAIGVSGGATPVGTLTANLVARVLGGSGAYSGLTGIGALQQRLTFALPTSTLDPAIDRALRNALGDFFGAAAAALPLSFPATTPPPPPATSELGVRLGTGKPTVVFSTPADVIVKPTDVLRVVTAPGASCGATAKQVLGLNKGRAVLFPTVIDKAKKGVVEFPGKLAARLGPVVWAVSVSCKSSVQRYDAAGRALPPETVKAQAEKRFRILGG